MKLTQYNLRWSTNMDYRRSRVLTMSNPKFRRDMEREAAWPSVKDFTVLIPFLLKTFPHHVADRSNEHFRLSWLEQRFRWLEAEIGPSAVRDGLSTPRYWTSGRWNFCGQDGVGYFVFQDLADAVAFKMRWG